MYIHAITFLSNEYNYEGVYDLIFIHSPCEEWKQLSEILRETLIIRQDVYIQPTYQGGAECPAARDEPYAAGHTPRSRARFK